MVVKLERSLIIYYIIYFFLGRRIKKGGGEKTLRAVSGPWWAMKWAGKDGKRADMGGAT